MSCIQTIADYGLRSIGIGERLLADLASYDRVVTWNGMQYDFRKLYQLTGSDREYRRYSRSCSIISRFNNWWYDWFGNFSCYFWFIIFYRISV